MLSRLRASAFADLPDSIKLHEVGLDPDVWEICDQKVSGSEKFGTVMFSLGVTVSLEMGQATVGGAVGMAHNQDPFGPVQADGHSDLLENEILFEIIARRSQRLGSSGDDNHIGALDSLLLQKLSHGQADTVIKAAEHSSIRHILLSWRIEMEDFAHQALILTVPRGCFYKGAQSIPQSNLRPVP
jgi:hypothetical protein